MQPDDVRPERLLPVLHRQVFEAAEHAVRGVADEKVEPAVARLDLVEERLDVLGVGHRAPDVVRLAAARLDGLGRLDAALARVERVDDDRRTEVGEVVGDVFAEAAPGAADEGDLAGQGFLRRRERGEALRSLAIPGVAVHGRRVAVRPVHVDGGRRREGLGGAVARRHRRRDRRQGRRGRLGQDDGGALQVGVQGLGESADGAELLRRQLGIWEPQP